jgi:hypothetical protein
MPDIKICSYCQIEKGVSEFGTRQRKMRNGNIKIYDSIYCLSCVAEKSKQWRKLHPDKVREQNQKPQAKLARETWLKNNKDKRKEYEHQYYLDNIEKFKQVSQTPQFKETKRLYKKNKRHNDPIFRIRENISNAILKALKSGKSNKAGKSILQFLEYTIQDLKIYLESQFDNQMSWDNYGNYWHIDHIIPQSDAFHFHSRRQF